MNSAPRTSSEQISGSPAAEASLAAVLSCRAGGDYTVVFANRDAEAVEAAIQQAVLATGSRTFLALECAFHGETLGALQLTANKLCRDLFEFSGRPVEGVCDASFTGALHPDLVRRITQPAELHGFELADHKTTCVLGFE